MSNKHKGSKEIKKWIDMTEKMFEYLTIWQIKA